MGRGPSVIPQRLKAAAAAAALSAAAERAAESAAAAAAAAAEPPLLPAPRLAPASLPVVLACCVVGRYTHAAVSGHRVWE